MRDTDERVTWAIEKGTKHFLRLFLPKGKSSQVVWDGGNELWMRSGRKEQGLDKMGPLNLR